MKRWILYAVLVLALLAGALGAYSFQASPGSEQELEEFEPTEKVPADSAVAFPVDI